MPLARCRPHHIRRRTPGLLSDPSLRGLSHAVTHLDATCELTQTTTTTIQLTKTTTTASATELHEQQSEVEFRRIQPADDNYQSLHTTLRIFAIVCVAVVAIHLLHLWWS